MPRDFGGPSAADMNFRATEGPKMTSEIRNVKLAGVVDRALNSAQTRGDRDLPELIQAVGEALDAKDPVAMDRLDPDSQRNIKLPEQAKLALRRAWDLAQKTGPK